MGTEGTLSTATPAWAALCSKIRSQGGFLTPSDLAGLREMDRMHMCLVRCGQSRFLAPAHCVELLVEIIWRDFKAQKHAGADMGASDYVRDVSLPAGDPIFGGRP